MSAYQSVGTKRNAVHRVLLENPGGVYVNQLVESTGFTGKAVMQVLNNMEHADLLRKEKMGEDFYKYFLRKQSDPAPIVPPTISFYLTSTQGWHRIVMLKRLRDRLIEEHHYTLNVIIADYEKAMREFEKEPSDKDSK